MNIYIKWLIIVGLNSILGFLLGYQTYSFPNILGMIAGIVTWYFLYLFFDIYLHKIDRKDISRKLVLSAAFRIPLQLTIVPEMYAGALAIGTIEALGITHTSPFIEYQASLSGIYSFVISYSTTLFTGLYLSTMCSIIYLIITLIDRVRGRK